MSASLKIFGNSKKSFVYSKNAHGFEKKFSNLKKNHEFETSSQIPKNVKKTWKINEFEKFKTLKKNHEFGKCSRNWKKLTNWKNIHEKYTYLKKYIDFESLWLENVLKFEFFL